MKTWKIITLLSYISIASSSAAIITPALPQIQTLLQLSHAALGGIISIFLFGYMLGQVIYGPLSNRLGRLMALRIGLVINLLGIMLCLYSGYQQSYYLLMLGRLLTALGASAGLCCTFILINELLSAEKARYVLSFAMVSFTVGIGVAVLLGGIITQYAHWYDCFWLLLLHGIIMLLTTY